MQIMVILVLLGLMFELEILVRLVLVGRVLGIMLLEMLIEMILQQLMEILFLLGLVLFTHVWSFC